MRVRAQDNSLGSKYVLLLRRDTWQWDEEEVVGVRRILPSGTTKWASTISGEQETQQIKLEGLAQKTRTVFPCATALFWLASWVFELCLAEDPPINSLCLSNRTRQKKHLLYLTWSSLQATDLFFKRIQSLLWWHNSNSVGILFLL